MAKVSWETIGEGEVHITIEGLGFLKVFFKSESLMLYFGKAYLKKTKEKRVYIYQWEIKDFFPERKVLVVKRRA